jgi:hypothetical protein
MGKFGRKALAAFLLSLAWGLIAAFVSVMWQRAWVQQLYNTLWGGAGPMVTFYTQIIAFNWILAFIVIFLMSWISSFIILLIIAALIAACGG